MGLVLEGNVKIQEILKKVDNDVLLSKDEAITLLNIENNSEEFYFLLNKANRLSRMEYGDKGYIFVQIGINSAPCTGNCGFCSMATEHYVVQAEVEKTWQEIKECVDQAVVQKTDALFLMTTADYPIEKFLDIGKRAKQCLPEGMMLIANVGDFDAATAKKLKDTGFTGVYHIVRLGEGKDTALPKEQRIQTLDAIKAAELDLIYCVEPIGPEHTYEEIAEEMIRARNYGVNIMACMKRVCVPQTPLFEKGEITDLELTKIAAVARLTTRPKQSMNVHEPKQLTLLAGVNQLYAEIGINPRDCKVETSNNRGFSIQQVADMLHQADYKTRAL